MDLCLRQLCLAAPSKDETVALMRDVFDLRPVHGSGDLSPYGLPKDGPMSAGGRAFLAEQGVENLLFAAGSDFIEVLFPTREDSSVARYIARRGGQGAGYMVIPQGDDVDQYVANAKEAGVRVIHEARYPAYADTQFHPKDSGGALLAVAAHLPVNVSGGAWYPAGTAWETLPPSSRIGGIAGARLQGDEPERLARRWGTLLGREVSGGGDAWRIGIGTATLTFEPAGGGVGGFTGVDLAALDRAGTLEAARAAGLEVADGVIHCLGMEWRLI